MKHYLMTTEAHFELAVKGDGGKAAQNAAQQAHARGGMEPQAGQAAQEKTPVFPGFANICESTQDGGVGAPRLELGTSALSGLRSNQLSYAPGG